MKELLYSKYFKWGLTATVSMVAAIIVFFTFDKVALIFGALSSLMSILSPFIFGIIMAYLLRPVYNQCEYRLERFLGKRGIKSQKVIASVAQGISVTVSVLLLLAIVAALIVMVLPQLMTSLYELVIELPDQAVKLIKWVNGLEFADPNMKDMLVTFTDKVMQNLDGWMEKTLMPYIKEVALTVSAGIMGAASFVFNLIIGVIVCIYILLSKTLFTAQSKKAIFSLFEKDTANMLIKGARYTDKVFNGFIVGNLIDSLLVGMITFIIMSIFQWPFALLVSALLAVTNLIPFFGPFIGGIPSAILILTEDPMKCLYFIIYMVIMQQVEGNIIKPKILSGSVDLSSFWILFAIIVGGGLFGFAGMILGVPVFTLIYAFVGWLIERRLKKKDLPEETNIYGDIDYYDFDEGKFRLLPENLVEERKEEKRNARKERKKKRLLDKIKHRSDNYGEEHLIETEDDKTD